MREFALLNSICAKPCPSIRPDLGTVRLGPGDDLAHLELKHGNMLFGADQVIDGRHVDYSRLPVESVGWKIVARCVSDVAAMAGAPVASVVAAAIPPTFDEQRTEALFEAVRLAALEMNCPLVGGDFAVLPGEHDAMVCSTTVIALAPAGGPITRAGAMEGDGVYVTGALGRSLREDGSGHHCSFRPRVGEAHELLKKIGVSLHAMIDISDGFGRDAGHIARQSNVSLEIDLEQLPRRDNATWQQAVGDGEDYELIFTAQGEVPKEVCGTPITKVGQVKRRQDGAPLVRAVDHGTTLALECLGWEHGRDDA